MHTKPDQLRLNAEGGSSKFRIILCALALLFVVWSVIQQTLWGDSAKPSQGEELKHQPHWSLQPLLKPVVPQVKDQSWARTPIDQFILAKLEEKGLRPSLPAAKRTLLRRVYFDLIGLPPTPAEMDAFLEDRSPVAYERVVDRLLASPRYGERWARHWLDVVHYAETHGHDQDRGRTNAWPYRDYVIDSFNADKAYAQFVQEQIAGDVLFPDDPQAIIAMGFLASGPWDESSLRDIREDTVDRQIARYLDRDDIVTTVMNTFVSTTVQCARCHDHKFDPISQEEYYGLQAVFAATDKANRSFDPDPQVHSRRRSLLKQQQAIERKEKAYLASLSTPAFENELVRWESRLTNRPITWTSLEPFSLVSSNGATLTRRADGSVLSEGKRPETDTYVIAAETKIERVTAVRLEVLTDESLPHKGPGRQDNGNLHLTDFRLYEIEPAAKAELASSAGASSIGADGAQPRRSSVDPELAKPLALQNPTADFNQAGWGIAHAIDNDPKSAWGIYPEVGKSHHADFELKAQFTAPRSFESAALSELSRESN